MRSERPGGRRYLSEAARLRDVDTRIEGHLKANGRWDFLSLLMMLAGFLVIGGSIVAIMHDAQSHGFEVLEGLAIAFGAAVLSFGLVLRFSRRRKFERLVRERIADPSEKR